MKNFIKSSDKNTIEKLKKLGYQVINVTGNVTTFINDPKIAGKFDENKVLYSNILPMT
jgi:tyrosyl-tRNA synthetase